MQRVQFPLRWTAAEDRVIIEHTGAILAQESQLKIQEIFSLKIHISLTHAHLPPFSFSPSSLSSFLCLCSSLFFYTDLPCPTSSFLPFRSLLFAFSLLFSFISLRSSFCYVLSHLSARILFALRFARLRSLVNLASVCSAQFRSAQLSFSLSSLASLCLTYRSFALPSLNSLYIV